LSPAIDITRPVPKWENGASLPSFLDTGTPEIVSQCCQFTPFSSIFWWHPPQLPSKINRYTRRLIFSVTPVLSTKLSNSIGTFSGSFARAFAPVPFLLPVFPASLLPRLLASVVGLFSTRVPRKDPCKFIRVNKRAIFSRHTRASDIALQARQKNDRNPASPDEGRERSNACAPRRASGGFSCLVTGYSPPGTIFSPCLLPATSPDTLSCPTSDMRNPTED